MLTSCCTGGLAERDVQHVLALLRAGVRGTRLRSALIRASRFSFDKLSLMLTMRLSQMTRAEAALLSFSRLAQVALVAELDQAAEVEQAALVFFKGVSRNNDGFRRTLTGHFADQAELFAATVDDPKSLPWEVLQIAEVTLEVRERPS